MTVENQQIELIKSISERITNSGLRPEVQLWLTSEIKNLSSIVDRYKNHPEMIEIPNEVSEEISLSRRELRNNPLLIVDTILLSGEILYGYQTLYKKALFDIAETSGVDPNNTSFENLASEIEKATVDREKAKIQKYKQQGNKLAIPILGIGGTGKGTMIKVSGLPRVVNHTTRQRRPGETEGVDYYYIEGVTLEGYKINESDKQGETYDYYEQVYGPFVADLIRPGRGRYSTSVKSINDSLANSDVVFIEQSPEQVVVLGNKIPELMKDVQVVPVCILPPGSGILELATRVVVRTYGDPNHKDENVSSQYKIKESYLESTVGPGQIAEISQTANFAKGKNPLGIAYIVNDDLQRAVATLKNLVS